MVQGWGLEGWGLGLADFSKGKKQVVKGFRQLILKVGKIECFFSEGGVL